MTAVNDALQAKVTDILGADVFREVTSILKLCEVAEEEIHAAMLRHPDKAELLNQAFMVLMPSSERMHVEFVYRSHCREILERVAAGEDCREATNAELAILCSEASAVAPLTSEATLIYMRVWIAAFPDRPAFEACLLPSYEDVVGQRAARAEQQMRKLSRVSDRVFAPKVPS